MNDTTKKTTFLLLGHWALNMGDVAIAQATVADILGQFPFSRIIIESSHPEITKKFIPFVEIIPRILRFDTIDDVDNIYSLDFVIKNPFFVISSAFKLGLQFLFQATLWNPFQIKNFYVFKETDIVVFVGGDYISENYAFFQRFAEIKTAKKLKKPVILYAQTIGLFSDKNIPQVKKTLSLVDTIIVRDAKSKENLERYGVKSNIVFNADIATLLKPSYENGNQLLKDFPIPDNCVGLVPRATKYTSLGKGSHDSYTNGIITLIKKLVEKGYRIMFFPTNPNDAKVCEYINKALETDYPVVPTVEYSPTDVKGAFGKLKFLISSRMHPMILATGANTPVYCIGHEFKMKEYLTMLGIEQNYSDMADLKEEELEEKVVKAVENWKETKELIKTTFKEVQEKSSRSVWEINNLLR